MSSPKLSLPERFLTWLSDLVYHRPRWFIYPQIVLFIVCVVYTVMALGFNTKRNDLVGGEKKYHQNFLKYKEEFPRQDDLVVVVESDRLEKNRQFVERLGARMEAETNLFVDVFYKGDLKLMGPKALLFVPEDDLGELQKTLVEYKPFVQNFAQATNLNSLFQLINSQFLKAGRDTNVDVKPMIKALPALERIVRQAKDSMDRPGMPPSPGVNALFGQGAEAEQQIYITFDSGRIYLVTAQAVNEDKTEDAIKRLRELVAEVQKEVPGVNVGVTGEPILEFDEMLQSQKDTLMATIVSLVLCAIIFIYGYQESGRPIKATACLVIGLGYTMGYTTLTVGHLNILTITFAPMLIGMAIDFGVHLVTRYEEELRHGATEQVALQKAMVNTGLGIFTGCLTTAGAFFAMSLTDFKGIQEMGVIAGGGLVICLIPMMTMLPALLLRGRQNVIDHAHVTRPEDDKRAEIERIWLDRPYTVITLTVIATVISVWASRHVYFDYNLLNMQSKGLPAVVFEEKLVHSASNSVLYCAVVVDNLPEAVAVEKKLKGLSTVADVQSMGRYLAENQQGKLQLVTKVKETVADIRFTEVDEKPVKIPELSLTLYSLQGYLGAGIEVVHAEGEKELEGNMKSLWDAVGELRTRINAGEKEANGYQLAYYQQALLQDLRDTFASLRSQDDRAPLRAQDLPQALRNRFIGIHGKYLIQVFPKDDVWRRDVQEKFVAELRQNLDPKDTNHPIITGTPVQLLEYTDLLRKSYEEAAWYALGAIAIMVFIHFRSLTCVILSLLPVALGSIWTMGIMGYFGIPFNPANIMTLPLVVGVGVTNGIHILNRFAEEQSPSILAKSTGKAVIVSALTTIAGFGSLILADHQGIKSLGWVMSLGTGACMFAALTFLPALLMLLIKLGWQIRKTQ
jgi:hopanoid biosynthesis associated RND transporter like protein HpnN